MTEIKSELDANAVALDILSDFQTEMVEAFFLNGGFFTKVEEAPEKFRVLIQTLISDSNSYTYYSLEGAAKLVRLYSDYIPDDKGLWEGLTDPQAILNVQAGFAFHQAIAAKIDEFLLNLSETFNQWREAKDDEEDWWANAEFSWDDESDFSSTIVYQFVEESLAQQDPQHELL